LLQQTVVVPIRGICHAFTRGRSKSFTEVFMRALGLAGSLALLLSAPLAAQSKAFRTDDILRSTQTQQSQRDVRGSREKIPPGQLPPAGMCRIWIDGVPPGQQPAPTDCQTAVATKPANARVIWGNEQSFPGKGKSKLKSENAKNGDLQKQKGRGHANDDGDDDDDDNGSVSSRRNGSVIGGSLPTTTRDLSKKPKKGKGGD
jgi:hypothetical protein